MEENTADPVVEVTWNAWVPDSGCGCGRCGAEAHAPTEGELLDKLGA
jgi:hypothetical protein